MDDSEVDMENAEKLVADDLRNSRQGQQEAEHKQQEQLHVEGQTSCKEGKGQKNIDIQMNHEILGGNDMEDLGGHNEILGEKNLNKKTLESGENLFEEEKDTGKSPQQSTELLSDSGVDRNGEVENKVDAACLNAIPELNETPAAGQVEPITPTALVKCNETSNDQSADANDIKMIEEAETGTPEEQAAFIKELESFYKKERGMDFKPPKFYGKILNCLKLYRAVIRLGGYDLVTGTKLWRQIGESFHPPKTCTTVSYAFRIFYEKALLEYERHKMQNGELQLVLPSVPEHVIVENQTPKGSGRARRDAAARAMQGWHEQRQNDYGEIAEPIIKEKSLNKMVRHEKYIKSTGSVKHKRPREVEHPVKAARAETSKQLHTTIVDVGPPADWVKINVRENKDCFEVYALVPGLLREEVRVQSDPEGRLVITGQPEHLDNPWGITPFQKVISLPTRIDPFQTSAVVSLHGRLFIRIPFDPSM